MERVAKSRVSNRSDSKKSDSGRVGIPKSRIRVPKKSGILSGIMKQNIKFGVKSAQYPKKYPTFWVHESDFLDFPP